MKTQKPSDNSESRESTPVPAFPEEIWKEALEETRREEKKDKGPPVLWPMND